MTPHPGPTKNIQRGTQESILQKLPKQGAFGNHWHKLLEVGQPIQKISFNILQLVTCNITRNPNHLFVISFQFQVQKKYTEGS